MADLKELEARIIRLEDIETIKQIKSKHLLSLETGNWQDIVDLFTENCYIKSGHMGVKQGKKELTDFYAQNEVGRGLAVHHKHNHMIEITGETTAKGILSFQAMLERSGKAYWIAGTEEEEYLKENGSWKIDKCIVTFSFLTEYEQGWAKQRLASFLDETSHNNTTD